jgi:lipoyl(octanoyl) transferase
MSSVLLPALPPILLPILPQIKRLGQVDYEPTWRAMQAFTANRSADTHDEFWLLQHPPIFTLGMAGKPEHLRADIGIPVLHVDRGGQITYHGPGQVVIYLLLDLRRSGLGIKACVQRMEQAVIDTLADYGIAAARQDGAPGVYVAGAKIAALGLRVKNGCTYHGLSLNVDMDLTPYQAINPCGYTGMQVTQMRDCVAPAKNTRTHNLTVDSVAENLLVHLQRQIWQKMVLQSGC